MCIFKGFFPIEFDETLGIPVGNPLAEHLCSRLEYAGKEGR